MQHRSRALASMAVALGLLGTSGYAMQQAAATDHAGGHGHDKVGICHRTGSESNPYVYIEVPKDEANGHITGTGKQHNHKIFWQTDGAWRGVAHKAGDERVDYYASAPEDCTDTTPPSSTPPTTAPPTTPPPTTAPPTTAPPTTAPPTTAPPSTTPPTTPPTTSGPPTATPPTSTPPTTPPAAKRAWFRAVAYCNTVRVEGRKNVASITHRHRGGRHVFVGHAKPGALFANGTATLRKVKHVKTGGGCSSGSSRSAAR